MKEMYYIYNNEAIASCVFLSILNKVGTLDIARSCLVLPFLLDDRTVNYLRRNQDVELNLEQLIREQSRLFISFNKRYLSLLPITINSLMLLSKSNQIKIENEISIDDFINFESEDLGDRFNKIEDITSKFLSIIEQYSTAQLYKILKVQL
ncbi:three component ABC system middle component [Flavobacterium soyangense]|uniref:Uncharacterized protein n=1 Tax=Flavobacterium soyangense TaxID=2023265 RepID=A0A930U5V5_9FLAO|nr:three component ABC system middle component [Flavobacterium soyangense]MBF2707438.1 hypothetical protein [Flavobacterium soyangense]